LKGLAGIAAEATGSQHSARTILIVLGILVGVLIVGALLWTFAQVAVEHLRGVPRFAGEFTGQFIGILIGGAVLGLILAAIGVNALVSLLVGIGAAVVFIIFVSG
jgi:hypothetical protein